MVLKASERRRQLWSRRFAADSPLEGDGFEPSVPGAKEPVSGGEGDLRVIETEASHKKLFLLRGTDISNPSSSSGESCANLTFGRIPSMAVGRKLVRLAIDDLARFSSGARRPKDSRRGYPVAQERRLRIFLIADERQRCPGNESIGRRCTPSAAEVGRGAPGARPTPKSKYTESL
jgi:hypothetical protein